MSRSRVSSSVASSKAGSSRVSSSVSPSHSAVPGSTVAGSTMAGSTFASNMASGIRPSTVGGSVSNVNASQIAGLSQVDLEDLGGSAPKSTVEEVVASSLKDRKMLAVKMVGVGFVNIPPVIVRHKFVLSFILYLMFSLNSIVLGAILYGTHKALNEYCYNPVDPDFSTRSNSGEPFTCLPVSPQGLINTQLGSLLIYMFQIGSVLHTIALAVGVFGCMYLNIFSVLIFMVFYLISYTLMLTSVALEFFYVQIGLPNYYDFSQMTLGLVLSYVLFEICMFAMVVYLIIRWLSHLAQ